MYSTLLNCMKGFGFVVNRLWFLLYGHLQMEAFSRTETFPKIIEVYSRPTRIIRGKEIESALEVLA